VIHEWYNSLKTTFRHISGQYAPQKHLRERGQGYPHAALTWLPNLNTPKAVYFYPVLSAGSDRRRSPKDCRPPRESAVRFGLQPSQGRVAQ